MGGTLPSINRTYTKSRDWRLAFRTQSGCGIHHYSPRSHGGTQTRSTVLKGFPSMAHQRAPAKPWPDQPPEWEMRMSGCRWTPIRLRVRALAVVRWRTVLESQPVFRGLFLALAVAAFVASCGNDAGDAVGKKNHEWLTRRWKHLKILWPPMAPDGSTSRYSGPRCCLEHRSAGQSQPCMPFWPSSPPRPESHPTSGDGP